MTSITQYVLKTLPEFIYRYDSYKDENGNGLFIRFIHSLLSEIDEFIIPFLDVKLYNQRTPVDINRGDDRIDSRMISFLSSDLGSFPNFTGTEEGFRIVLANINRFYRLKGTQAGLEALFIPLGYRPIVYFTDESNSVTHDTTGIDHDSELNNIEIIHDSFCEVCSTAILLLVEITDAEPVPLVDSDVLEIAPLLFPVYLTIAGVFITDESSLPSVLQTTETGGPEDVQDITGEDIYILP